MRLIYDRLRAHLRDVRGRVQCAARTVGLEWEVRAVGGVSILVALSPRWELTGPPGDSGHRGKPGVRPGAPSQRGQQSLPGAWAQGTSQ